MWVDPLLVQINELVHQVVFGLSENKDSGLEVLEDVASNLTGDSTQTLDLPLLSGSVANLAPDGVLWVGSATLCPRGRDGAKLMAAARSLLLLLGGHDGAEQVADFAAGLIRRFGNDSAHG